MLLKIVAIFSFILSVSAYTENGSKMTCEGMCMEKCKVEVEKKLENVRITKEGFEEMILNCVKECKGKNC